MTPKERRDALDVILAESTLRGLWHAQRWLNTAESYGRKLHAIYEGQCSVDLGTEGNARRDREEARYERLLREHFASVGLGLYLNGDPRGNPVGILTPKTGRHNTTGGAECGWRL